MPRVHRAGKVHPLLTRHGYANVGVDCVRKHGSPDKLRGCIDKRKTTRLRMSPVIGTSSSERKLSSPRDGRAEARELMQSTAMCQEVHA